PGPEVGRRFLPEREASFLPALAENANARGSFETHIPQREFHQFRDAQPARKAEMEHSTVADSEAGCCVRRVENGADLVHREMPHQSLIMAFARDGMNLSRLCKGRRDAKFDIPDKGL